MMKRTRRLTALILAGFLAVLPVAALDSPGAALAAPKPSGSAQGRTAAARPLMVGARGLDVAAIQITLKHNGYSLKVDGIFGMRTHRVVSSFQRSNGLKPTGIVSGRTRSLLVAEAQPVTKVPRKAGAPVVRFVPGAGVEQWHALALEVGWPEAQWPMMACVMTRESHGNPAAKNPGSSATGLMQVLATGWPGVDLFDPRTNLSVAWTMYNSRSAHGIRGWSPWGGGC